MSKDVSSEWLKKIGQLLDAMRTVLTVTAVLVVGILLTLFNQHRKMKADEQKRTETQAANWTEWQGLQAVYEEFPNRYVPDEFDPWYSLTMRVIVVTTWIENANIPALKASTDPQSQTMLRLIEAGQALGIKRGDSARISACFWALKAYNPNLRSILWSTQAKIPFENLSREKLEALVRAFTFNPDEQIRDGCRLARTVARGYFKSGMDQVKNGSGEPAFNEQFNGPLRAADHLSTVITLNARLMTDNLATFQDFKINDATKSKLLNALEKIPFSSLHELRQEDLHLSKEIQSLQNNDADSPIKLPFLDAPVTLSDFSYMSAGLNAVLLLWVIFLVAQFRKGVMYYRAAGGDINIVSEVMPLATVGTHWIWPLLIGMAVFLSLPSILGTALLLKGGTSNVGTTHLYGLLSIGIFLLAISAVWGAARAGVVMATRKPTILSGSES